jgi:hypothetical protein
MGTKVKITLIEAYNFIGIIEYYYGLIQYTYLIIMAKVNGINKDTILQIAFKAINDFAGPNNIILTLLVYGTLPRITEYNTPLLTIL